MRADQITPRALPSAAALSRAPRLLAIPLTLAFLLALFATPALAVKTHRLKASFDTADFGAGIPGIAVDEASGNVFSSQRFPINCVLVTGPEGAPPSGVSQDEICGFTATPTGVAVDNSSTSPAKGSLYVAEAGIYPGEGGPVRRFALEGGEYKLKGELSATPALGQVGGLATDSEGNLFVTDNDGKAVVEFDPAGTQIARLDLSASIGGLPLQVALDSAGDLFIGANNGAFYRLKANGSGEVEPGTEAEQIVEAGGSGGAAVDRGTDDLYVSRTRDELGRRVEQFSAACTTVGEGANEHCTPQGEFGGAIFSSPGRIAVNSKTGYVYVSNYISDAVGNRVAVFGPTVIVPAALTGKATAVTGTTATLNATVDPAGSLVTECKFEWGLSTAYENTTPCKETPAEIGAGNGPVAVHLDLTSLGIGTKYHYRLVATSPTTEPNEKGPSVGADASFTTDGPQVYSESFSQITDTAATLEGVLSPHGADSTCVFEYGTTTAYGQQVPCSPEAQAATNEVQSLKVSATAGQFKLSFAGQSTAAIAFDAPSSTVEERLEALSTIGPANLSVSGGPGNQNGTSPYIVTFEGALGGRDVEALTYQSGTPPLGGFLSVSTLSSPIATVSGQLKGLSPATTYHFRIAATNASGTAHGLDRTLTTYGAAPVFPACPNDALREALGSTALPDCRAYEQVTPTDKNGAAPIVTNELVQAASGGGAITYGSGGGIPGPLGSQQFPNLLASRGTDWSTSGLLPPASSGSSAAVLGWSEDLADHYVIQATLPGAPLSLLARDSSDGSMQTIAEGVDLDIGTAYRFVADSADGSLVAFESEAKLVGKGASTKGPNVYVWDRAGGAISLAGALNSGSAPANGAFAGSTLSPTGQHYNQAQHALSSDGSRLFFRDAASSQLYLRQNPTQPQSPLDAGKKCTDPALACSAQISASQRTTAPLKDEKPSVFWGATPDGSAAFFTSAAKLTENATTGPADEGADLYRYDAQTGVLTDLTPDTEPGDPAGAQVRGVLGASADGSRVYFAANGVLAPGASHGNCNDTSNPSASGTGTCNLYLSEDGAITFIAAIEGNGDNWRSRGQNTSRVSAGGQALLFRSSLKLTDYDNHAIPELYLYSAAAKELTCISCNPTGVAPIATVDLGAPTLRRGIKGLGTIPSPAAVLPRNLSADGDRVFFETADKLLAADTNGDQHCTIPDSDNQLSAPQCQDVYEWEADGTGSCESEAQNGGCLYLISTGTSPEPSFFADASVSGEDVFFLTGEGLVGQDTDQIADIYDARAAGGISSQDPPLPPPICAGEEACKGPLPAAPQTTSPGTEQFLPAAPPPPCPKGKARKHGRCVAKKGGSRKGRHHHKGRAPGRHR